MRRLQLVSLCLISLATPALAQQTLSLTASEPPSSASAPTLSLDASSASEEAMSSAEDMASSSEESEPEEKPIASADLLKLIVDSCTAIATGGADVAATLEQKGWTANDTDDASPYSAIYAGYQTFAGYDEVDIWGAVYTFPTQKLGYCRVDFSDSEAGIDLNGLTGLGGLTGTIKQGAEGNVSGAWESADKTLLVIGDRTDGAVEIEFNLLPGSTPAQ